MTSEQLLHTAILIPSLEPDHRLVTYAKDLENAGFSHRIIVDDGSGESFQPIFTQLEKEGCVVLHHDVNHGKGVALKTGYRWIQENMPECEAVLTADSDGQHTVPDCLSVISKLYDGEDALYLGSRDFSLPNVPPKSRIGNRSTSVVFKLCYGKWLPDTQTGLRAFRASELPFMISIEGDRYEYEMNVLISCARRGLPMIPVTIETVYENGNEGTHFHPIRDSWRIYKLILGSFFKFMGASLICVLVDQVFAGLFASWLLPLLGVTEHRTLVWLSGFLARLISSVVNFTLNKAFVFKMIQACAKAKARVVQKDMTEKNIRMQLNLGHTFGHALETCAGLGKIAHGDAVAWGIGRALCLSQKLGLCANEYKEEVFELLEYFGWETAAAPKCFCPKDGAKKILCAMKRDKKNSSNKVRVILQSGLCETVITEVSDKDILKCL